MGFSDKLKNMEIKDVFEIDIDGIQADCLSSYLDNRKESLNSFANMDVEVLGFDKILEGHEEDSDK